MSYLFTSESVSEGHPDKVADQISDAVVDAMLSRDPNAKVACETFVTTGLTVIGGEVKSNDKSAVDFQEIAREAIRKIGYTKSEYKFDAESCGILVALHEQSSDIRQGVERETEEAQGAGDQGMMFGYACNETESLMPLPIDMSHKILQVMAEVRKEGKEMTYLRPDSKSQVTVEYTDDHKPVRVHTIVVSTQHDDFAGEKAMQQKIQEDVIAVVMPRVKAMYSKNVQQLFDGEILFHVNPTGKFVIGGPHGDTGLTGRKIIVDTYGGRAAHGGGAFSGKDSSKVDRSAAYATRYIAKNLVAAGVADKVQVQVAYAIGVAEPVSINVDTFGTSRVGSDHVIEEKVSQLFDLKPSSYIKKLGLKNPIYSETAAYGHMGRTPGLKQVEILGEKTTVETFTWEKTDAMDIIKQAFGL